MSWAQIIAAIKMGLVASAESVANIISGVTKVGNADKLDGYDASSFALVEGYIPNQYSSTTSDNADQILADLHNNATNGEYYTAKISFSVSHPALGGADRIIIGYRAADKYGWQIGISYSYAGTKNIMLREMWDGAWRDWKEFAITADLAKYLPLTGGTITANTFAPLRIERNNSSAIQVALPFILAGVTLASIGAKTDGELYIYDASGNEKAKMLHTSNYKALITELNAKPADERTVATLPDDYNSVFKIRGIKSNTSINLPATGGIYSTVYGIRGWSDSSGGNAHEFALHGGGEIYHRHGATTEWSAWRKLLHTGNSVPVVVSTTAPSDTTAVWIIPS